MIDELGLPMIIFYSALVVLTLINIYFAVPMKTFYCHCVDLMKKPIVIPLRYTPV